MSRGTHFRKLYAALLAAAGFVTCAASAQAGMIALNPGGTVAIEATTRTEHPELQGDPLDDVIVPFYLYKSDGTIAIAGHLHNRVFRSRIDGTLDFYYRIVNDSNVVQSGDYLNLTTDGFAGLQTEANYRADGIGQTHFDEASRSSDGNSVSFILNQLLGDMDASNGYGSLFHYVKTNATQYTRNGRTKIQVAGASAGDPDTTPAILETFEPVPLPAVAIPLPMGAWLSLAGLGTAWFFRKRVLAAC